MLMRFMKLQTIDILVALFFRMTNTQAWKTFTELTKAVSYIYVYRLSDLAWNKVVS